MCPHSTKPRGVEHGHCHQSSATVRIPVIRCKGTTGAHLLTLKSMLLNDFTGSSFFSIIAHVTHTSIPVMGARGRHEW